MPNLKQKISQHNKKISQPTPIQPPKTCNCTKVIGDCPLEGNCLTTGVVYRAEVVPQNSSVETYTGVTKNAFKTRFYQHRDSFKSKFSDKSTTLSSFIWKLKDRGRGIMSTGVLLIKAVNDLQIPVRFRQDVIGI